MLNEKTIHLLVALAKEESLTAQSNFVLSHNVSKPAKMKNFEPEFLTSKRFSCSLII